MEKTNAKGSVSKKAVKAVAPVKKPETKPEIKEVKAKADKITAMAIIDKPETFVKAVKEKVAKAVKTEAKVETKPVKKEKKPSAGQQIRELLGGIPDSKIDIKMLTDAAKCKEIFKLQYPLLKPATADDNDRKVNGYFRYGKTPMAFNKKKYWVTNNLFKQHIALFEDYIKGLK